MESTAFTFRETSLPSPPSPSPLGHMRVLIQPNLSVRGWPTSAGSRALEGFEALEDATIVTLLSKAGAFLIGSAHMSELGLGLSGDTVAQLIAQGQAQIGIMTDTLGEARLAAAHARLFGFKPSQGTVSRLGLIGLVPSMECCGVVGRNLEDIVSAMTAISKRDPQDVSMTKEALPDFDSVPSLRSETARLVVVEEYLDTLESREARAFEHALRRIERHAGLPVKQVHLPDYHLFAPIHQVVGSVEASSSAGKYDGVRYGHRTPSARNWNEMYLNSRGESFNTLIKSYLFQGAYFQFERYASFENACRIRARLLDQAREAMADTDCLVFLTRRPAHDPYRAATIKATYDAFASTLAANVTGQPSIQIPGLVADSEDDDLGVLLTGPALSDPLLLSIALHISKSNKGVSLT